MGKFFEGGDRKGQLEGGVRGIVGVEGLGGGEEDMMRYCYDICDELL